MNSVLSVLLLLVVTGEAVAQQRAVDRPVGRWITPDFSTYVYPTGTGVSLRTAGSFAYVPAYVVREWAYDPEERELVFVLEEAGDRQRSAQTVLAHYGEAAHTVNDITLTALTLERIRVEVVVGGEDFEIFGRARWASAGKITNTVQIPPGLDQLHDALSDEHGAVQLVVTPEFLIAEDLECEAHIRIVRQAVIDAFEDIAGDAAGCVVDRKGEQELRVRITDELIVDLPSGACLDALAVLVDDTLDLLMDDLAAGTTMELLRDELVPGLIWTVGGARRELEAEDIATITHSLKSSDEWVRVSEDEARRIFESHKGIQDAKVFHSRVKGSLDTGSGGGGWGFSARLHYKKNWDDLSIDTKERIDIERQDSDEFTRTFIDESKKSWHDFTGKKWETRTEPKSVFLYVKRRERISNTIHAHLRTHVAGEVVPRTFPYGILSRPVAPPRERVVAVQTGRVSTPRFPGWAKIPVMAKGTPAASFPFGVWFDDQYDGRRHAMWQKTIRFPEPFEEKPRVLASVMKLDAHFPSDPDQNGSSIERWWINVIGIERDRFTLQVVFWHGEQRPHDVDLGWIAIGEQ